MGNAGICPKCGGEGTIWTGEKRIICRECHGKGTIQPIH